MSGAGAESLAALLWYPISAILAAAATVVIFGISIPFMGVLVRYRANYTPKRVHLDMEDGQDGDPGSESSISYLGMMKRVHRVEGWSGLYKGIMPSIIASLITPLAFLPVIIVTTILNPLQPQFLAPITAFALSLVPVVLLVPMQIFINRAITTPHKLAAFAPQAALRVLLSPAEQAEPLKLYLTPGVALSEVLRGLVPVTVGVLRQFVAPRVYSTHQISILAAALPVLALTTALLTPLQVMGTRLTLQRLADPSTITLEDDTIPAEDADVASTYSEEVIEFRSRTQNLAPYASLRDCGESIVREEGWKVLFRAWWITALFVILPIIIAGAPLTPRDLARVYIP
ncbi:hypothetical protein C8R43DRAFT_994264 [Mycena crocata]|nr:hypothetical protein C8R43DRAFT_994264 [Mycena crocata]